MVDIERTPADLASVDALARLELVARQLGCSIRLRHTTGALRELIELVGLSDVLRLEAEWEPEGREELGVQEVMQPGDPAV